MGHDLQRILYQDKLMTNLSKTYAIHEILCKSGPWVWSVEGGEGEQWRLVAINVTADA